MLPPFPWLWQWPLHSLKVHLSFLSVIIPDHRHRNTALSFHFPLILPWQVASWKGKKKSDNLSFGKTAKFCSGLGFLPVFPCCFSLSKLRPSCNPQWLIQRSPGLAGKASWGARGEGMQSGTAFSCDVLVCSLFCSQVPKPPKDEEAIGQWMRGCMSSDYEGWRHAHTKAVGAEDCKIPAFSVRCIRPQQLLEKLY